MNAIQQALDCLKNGNRTWEAMEILEKAIDLQQQTDGVLQQLRAEREALTLQVEEQRKLLEQARDELAWINQASKTAAAITQHLKGKE